LQYPLSSAALILASFCKVFSAFALNVSAITPPS
jgi:hypothetical protein